MTPLISLYTLKDSYFFNNIVRIFIFLITYQKFFQVRYRHLNDSCYKLKLKYKQMRIKKIAIISILIGRFDINLKLILMHDFFWDPNLITTQLRNKFCTIQNCSKDNSLNGIDQKQRCSCSNLVLVGSHSYLITYSHTMRFVNTRSQRLRPIPILNRPKSFS